ncbi:polyketide biosynthesis acyl carrier protein [Lachnotalea glycerini]|jgi:polyketide biosynthesis acyl carrier protein|uniref:Acyl carrier protein n=1 Tax=Lachnotalea glycerini TaxID=1763509 RepID=A0A255ILL5_9FIRM|nr:phosphopantetheine-binding protein [Lachnotalea glycerini]OYO76132.1 acyl carrier protein [Lachnotalea glycerini]PXV95608.1 polyketide biosynthesis acyl carrier protein [Lachnotalea glycerini]RDY32898.1 acyl carrier protein [Lachnotalea glycerini]
MNREEVFEKLSEIMIEYIPELNGVTFTMEDSLHELGANSVDRMDIIVDIMEELGVKVSITKFANAKNIKEIIDILCEEYV